MNTIFFIFCVAICASGLSILVYLAFQKLSEPSPVLHIVREERAPASARVVLTTPVPRASEPTISEIRAKAPSDASDDEATTVFVATG